MLRIKTINNFLEMNDIDTSMELYAQVDDDVVVNADKEETASAHQSYVLAIRSLKDRSVGLIHVVSSKNEFNAANHSFPPRNRRLPIPSSLRTMNDATDVVIKPAVASTSYFGIAAVPSQEFNLKNKVSTLRQRKAARPTIIHELDQMRMRKSKSLGELWKRESHTEHAGISHF